MKKIVEAFEQTFTDKVFSRSEKRAIKKMLKEHKLTKRKKDKLRSILFDMAAKELKGHSHKMVVNWLETANKIVINAGEGDDATIDEKNEVYFSPGEECLNAINRELGKATQNIDICVFTISDNRISGKITECYKRGIKIRIITDDDKSFDRGSDIEYLVKQGINIRIDRTRHHMHHKFAVIDNATVLTGSYNWTRSAEQYNHENVLITDNKKIADKYCAEFEHLWSQMREYNL